MSEPTYLPVNWADGMKLNKTHFAAQEKALVYQMAQNINSLLNDNNYGLLPFLQNNKSGVRLFLSLDNQQAVHLRLLQCRAITRGGYFVEINEESNLSNRTLQVPLYELSVPFETLKEKSSAFYVVLTINPFERVPFGQADPEELPPRLPFTLPSLSLDLLPVQAAVPGSIGLYQIVVGKLLIEEQKALLDFQYIPPCSSMNSFPDLIEIHGRLEQFYARMELYAMQIMQKIFQKKQSNEMADIVRVWCERITDLTATQLTEIKFLSLQQPPVFFISKIVAFARSMKNTLDHYLGSGKEELMDYCAEWCDIGQGELEIATTALANHQYDHLNIQESIEKIIPFTRIVSLLFAALSRLEYIGVRRDTGIFIKEQPVIKNAALAAVVPSSLSQPEPPVKKRSSFLADD